MALFDRSERRRTSEEKTPEPAAKASPTPKNAERANPAQPKPTQPTATKADPAQPKYPSSGAPLAAESARIGPGLGIDGEIHGDEDLILDGRVRGSVSLGKHQLLIGEAGSAEADVSAKKVVVYGEVIGNIQATETVELRRTAKVKGNIRTANLSIEEGATLQGRVEMGSSQETKTKPNGTKQPKQSNETAPAPA